MDNLTLFARRALDWITYVIVRLMVAAIQVLPLDMGASLSSGVAFLLGDCLGIRGSVTRENFDLVHPNLSTTERRQLSRRMWNHLILMVCEIAWAQRRLHRCNWYRHVGLVENKTLLRLILSDRPVVLVTGHFGNFEIAGYLVGLMGVRSTSIARPLDNPYLHRWVERFRRAKGQDMVDKQGCAPIIDDHLRKGGLLSLLADQHAGEKGVWVDFCGVPASCHKALALFSMTSGAPMLATYTRRVNGMPMHFESGSIAVVDPQNDPLEICRSVDQLTRWYNAQLEKMIDLAPEQYWWLHRRWRTPPAKVSERLAKQRQAASNPIPLRQEASNG